MNSFWTYGFNAENIPYYNCRVANKTARQWFAEGEAGYGIALFSYIYGISALTAYTFVLIVLWRLTAKYSVYLIMFHLGCYDIINLIVNCFFTGYFSILGASYCTHPNMNYLIGCVGLGAWCAECVCCLILATSRILDLISGSLHEKVFGGSKLYAWLCVPFIWGFYFWYLHKPLLYSSALHIWHFSPTILKTVEETVMFSRNYVYVFNNIVIVSTTCILYVILYIVVWLNFGLTRFKKVQKFQRTIILQCVLIGMLNLQASFIFVFFNFFATPSWVVYLAQFGWQAAAGIPAFIYLSVNLTVREEVYIMLGYKIRGPPNTRSWFPIGVTQNRAEGSETK